jgi:predicted ATP-dependent endonuclease of OLD family
MKLSAIRIENFRSYKDKTILFDDFTCLVGPNGGGKSTVLMALNLFFRNSIPNNNLLLLVKDDFHHGNITDPVKITLTFEELSPEAQNDFKSYYRQGRLIVSAKAVWDPVAQNAPVMQYGSRLVMHDFKAYFAKNKEGEKVAALKEVYKELQKKYKDLPVATTKPDMEQSLMDYEEKHPELCTLSESNDQFYGYTKGADRLPKYVQWVFIPAVKDIASEQDENKKTAIGQLLERTVRAKVDFKQKIEELKKSAFAKYEEIINEESKVLEDLEKSLESRLKEWSHPGVEVGLNWNIDKDKSVSISEPLARVALGEDKFVGEIARLGHGLQRSFLVAILYELSLSNVETFPKLLLGFEEPEIFQHPPQARHMASLLESLTDKNSQIIVTTHSPYFVPGKGFENVRMIKKNANSCYSEVTQLTLAELEKSISGALGEQSKSLTAMVAAIEQIMQPSLKELFFTPKVILVEGIEDIAFISTYMQLLNLWPNFREHGCHFIATIGKTSLSRPLAIAKAFSIPAFVVFDGDIDKTDNTKENKRDNACIFNLCNVRMNPLSEEIIWAENVVMWPTRIFDIVKKDIGNAIWEEAEMKVRKENRWEELRQKNSLLITATLEELWKQGKKSAILSKLCECIVTFAKNTN